MVLAQKLWHMWQGKVPTLSSGVMVIVVPSTPLAAMVGLVPLPLKTIHNTVKSGCLDPDTRQVPAPAAGWQLAKMFPGVVISSDQWIAALFGNMVSFYSGHNKNLFSRREGVNLLDPTLPPICPIYIFIEFFQSTCR